MSKFKTRKFVIPTPDQPTVTITDDGYTIRAEWSTGTGSTSTGIRRPPPKPGETVDALFSLDRKFVYLPTYVHHGIEGAWMGTTEYATLDELKAAAKQGLGSPEYVSLIRRDEGNRETFRELLPFAMWKVSANKEREPLPKTDPLVQDYLAYCHAHDMRSLHRFEQEIAFTGRKYAWILEKIGPAVLAEPEPEPVVLTD